MVVLIVLLLLIFSWNLFIKGSDEPMNENVSVIEDNQVQPEINDNDEEVIEVVTDEISDEERVARLKAEYELLETERKNLKRRLAKLKHEMWGVEFAPEQAKNIQKTLIDAYKLIKNPDMLGAFSNVEAVQAELTKVDFALKSIEQVSEQIIEQKLINKEKG